MGFRHAIAKVLRHYGIFQGRAARSEYWWWTLSTIVILLLMYFALAAVIYHYIESGGVGEEGGFDKAGAIISGAEAFQYIFLLVILLPTIAVTARRLHDMNRSGWWMLLPGAFGLAVAALFAIDAMFGTWEETATGGVLVSPVSALTGPAAAGVLSILTSLAPLAFLAWMARKGTTGPNRFGPDPLEISASASPSSLP